MTPPHPTPPILGQPHIALLPYNWNLKFCLFKQDIEAFLYFNLGRLRGSTGHAPPTPPTPQKQMAVRPANPETPLPNLCKP